MKLSNNRFQLAATDLSNYLSCKHLTQLDRQVAEGKAKRPFWKDPSLEVLIQRGQEHEEAYKQHLQHKGKMCIDLKGKPVEATVNAMKEGFDVITQARLENGNCTGIADFLIKVAGKSKFGNWSYEVQDTKLSQNTRAGTILQLCLYTDLLSTLQETTPEKMYVVKPGVDFPTENYRFHEFAAYYRLVKQNIEKVLAGPPLDVYPDPVEHCGICSWWHQCNKKRHDDDHLSLVAGIQNLHIVELQKQKIQTLENFAKADKIEKPDRGNIETYLRKQEQAKTQWQGREENELIYNLLDLQAGRGLNRLPEPNDGDIYFDIEGDPFYPEGGLEYLLGFVYKENGKLVYNKLWATHRQDEKKTFIEFMQFVTERWNKYPGMYIYHFAPYEPSAIKRLAMVHAVNETDVDNLLRAQRFIDLHLVFKEAMLASVESYSLKELEKFPKYVRQAELRDASIARKSVEVALELNEFNSIPAKTGKIVEVYNEDDCQATKALHEWLENERQRLVDSGKELTRPEIKPGDAGENVQEQDEASLELFNKLTEGLPEDRSTWTDEHKAKWLLAHQIDYFRREEKTAWWEFFRLHEMDDDDLFDERKAIAGLQFINELPKEKRERNPTHRYKFPPQEISFEPGADLYEVKGDKIGTVKSISPDDHIIDIKKSGNAIQIHPSSIHVKEMVSAKTLAASLRDLAEQIVEYGLDHNWPFHASKDLLMKRSPQLRDGMEGAHLLEGEDTVNGAIRLASMLDRSVLAIQGPPGTGKTYTGARMIIELLKEKKKIGITAVSHKVIRNLAEATIKEAKKENYSVSFVHKTGGKSDDLPDEILEVASSQTALEGLGEGKVVCGTAWLWAEENSREVLDYLFVDEAGQMSLAHVLAASRSAQNIILLGDPQQLEQPQKGSHPEGSDVAALTHLLDGHQTMPEGKGLFLPVTWRLHPKICEFTSEIFYENRLKSKPGLEKQLISGGTPFDGAGLFYAPVEHRGNQNKSLEEVEAVVKIIEKLLATGKWTSEDNKTSPLQNEDILIVAPYNAQVAALMEKLPGFHIGTVDKFQGQQAPVVIYSMTSSSPEDAPRGMSFLYNLNRLNVATSRAKSTCILVASPELFKPECKTIDQMKWANGLCRFGELVY